jgi:hypothetical protein
VIDGKTVRGTITFEDLLDCTYWPRIILMQMEVKKDTENEIVVAPKLLDRLDLHNKIVIGDAMHTQRQISVQIVELGGDFVWVA